ncbi:MAG: DUF6048 family protein [Cyclobacteriaceae bacterium]
MMSNTLSLKILFLSLVILTHSLENASAQAAQDTVKTDTLRNKYFPTGIRVGTDIISLVKTRTQDNFSGWEVNGEIDFNRYYFTLEYGKWGRNFNSDSAAYMNDGRYWRAGVDVNFLTKDPDRNVFFLGARYGRSVFSESLSIKLYDPIWGLLVDDFYHSDVNAWWLEITTGLRVKIWKIFWIGYTGRLKFALSSDVTDEMLPHDVPGFGKTDKETTWGFNYYLMIRLPIRKAPPPPAKK